MVLCKHTESTKTLIYVHVLCLEITIFSQFELHNKLSSYTEGIAFCLRDSWTVLGPVGNSIPWRPQGKQINVLSVTCWQVRGPAFTAHLLQLLVKHYCPFLSRGHCVPASDADVSSNVCLCIPCVMMTVILLQYDHISEGGVKCFIWWDNNIDFERFNTLSCKLTCCF